MAEEETIRENIQIGYQGVWTLLSWKTQVVDWGKTDVAVWMQSSQVKGMNRQNYWITLALEILTLHMPGREGGMFSQDNGEAQATS